MDKKGGAVIVALVIIIVLLVLIIIGGIFYFFISKNSNNPNDPGITSTNSTKDYGVKIVDLPGGVTEAQLAGVKLNIADVTLSDNRDRVVDIRVLVTPIEKDASRSWKVILYLEKDGIREATNDGSLLGLTFSHLNAPTKVSLEQMSFHSTDWDPKYMKTGTYDLVIEILNSNTKEKLTSIKKPIQMELNAPKVQ